MRHIFWGWMSVVIGMSSSVVAQGWDPEYARQSNGYTYAPGSQYLTAPAWPGYAPYGAVSPNAYYYGAYPAGNGVWVTPGYYSPQPVPQSQMRDPSFLPPATALPVEANPWNGIARKNTNPAFRSVVASTAAARMKSLEYQMSGDQELRQRSWQRAFFHYRQAVKLADDQAVAHLKLGIVSAVLQQYDRAEMEFQRAVFIDPSLPTSNFTLEMLFGPDSKIARSSLLSRLAEWVNHDITNPQRLYVLGVLMHFDQDERAQDLFAAAERITGGAAPIAAFLSKAEGREFQPQPNPDPVASPFTRSVPRLNHKQPKGTPNGNLLEAPPAPGLNEETQTSPPVQSPLPAAPQPAPDAPPATIPRKSSDGPVLLPPSPAR